MSDRADEIARKWWPSIVDAVRDPTQNPREVFAAALRDCAKEERERCAKIADQAALQYNAAWVAEPIAARIREGGEEE